jgi:hypothetical protein
MLGCSIVAAYTRYRYLRDAELIYYNGIYHTQREKGGFGCDKYSLKKSTISV